MATYRILSLDGGGIRGLLTTVLLDRLAQEVPGWLDQVNLISGTSTGGIIALGLADGLSPADLQDLYYAHGHEIFDDSWQDDLIDLCGLRGADYDNTFLRRELVRLFEDRVLGDLQNRVLIPAFDLDNEKADPAKRSWAPKFFHNFDGSDSDSGRRIVDVALYTSAAPTYFPSVDGYIDGGVFANNPSMSALAQTQDPRADIDPRPSLGEVVLLSLGTGTTLYRIAGQRHDWGFGQWIKPLIDIMLDGGMGVAHYQCEQLLRERYHRLAPTFAPNQAIRLDDWRRRDDLVRVAEQTPIEDTVQWLAEHWI